MNYSTLYGKVYWFPDNRLETWMPETVDQTIYSSSVHVKDLWIPSEHKFLPVFHREDGPSFIAMNGNHCWFLNGRRHRVGGPAVIRPSGANEFWVNGEQRYF